MSQAEIENELRKHGSGFMGGKQRIMALYQTQPDRSLRAKALAKEYGIGGHSHDFLDGSRGFVNHDGKGLEFDHYPDHQKITLKWTQVEKYIDLMIQSDRYLTDKEKEHYTPPVPITVEPDATLTHAKNLIRDAADVRHFLFLQGVMVLAATRLIPMRKNKGKSIEACLHNHTRYIQNPDKTEQGELVSSYQCNPLTVDEEFLLTKRLYEQTTGRSQKSDVIAYQVRQSFKPGEVTPEEANRIGYEFAERFSKGKHAFIVATHTDRAHIHNHIIYNSTALDGTRKFKNFWLSTFAVQRLSDLICLEHQLSTIEYKPYRERQKRIVYPPKESNRDRLCGIIDTILAEKPGDYETFLQKLEQQDYEVKRGKHTAVKGKGQKRFIRFRTLGIGYGEDEIKAVLEGKAKHHPYQKQPPKEQPFQLLVDIQGKMASGKSVGYKKWATKFNLKEMSKTLLFLQEQKISSAVELRERAATAIERYHAIGDSIKAAEARLTEIAVLKTHIINYAKTREVYTAYRKAGYSKAFLEAHREEITLHKAAKAAFDEAGLQKLPKVKELDEEFAELLTQKKAAYPDYRKARNEMQELVRAQKNVERFFAEEKTVQENEQTR